RCQASRDLVAARRSQRFGIGFHVRNAGERACGRADPGARSAKTHAAYWQYCDARDRHRDVSPAGRISDRRRCARRRSQGAAAPGRMRRDFVTGRTRQPHRSRASQNRHSGPGKAVAGIGSNRQSRWGQDAGQRGHFVNVRTQPAASVTKPPFRAEHIGSLLRPPSLLRERARFAAGEIDAAELAAAEDAAIADAIRLQERLGFKFVTDGEFRRRSYHSFFYGALGQLRIDTIGGADAVGADGQGGRGVQPVAIVGSRVRWAHPINAVDAAFLKARSGRWPKITIPGPCALHFRGGDAAVTASAYQDVDQFWSDTIDAFTSELRALAAAGCRYVQIDETAFAKFGDPRVQSALAARGDDWSALIDKYIAVTNRLLAAAPKEMYIGMHLCRGNRGGHWHAEGSYEEVAERLFNALAIRFYFLE